ncbi:MFS transporter [Reichenbachiella versicolor]|uniref:MFS transporter n=1 Tax=Reichenbachiella versicolor TaxID=1821036 RepID=UPI000D6DDEB5|nr:MFS transporter [Reichenbachiella versicolor]
MKNKYLQNLLILILCGEAVFFLPFVLVRIFRPTILEAFSLSNTELGYAFSLYGISAMVSYFIGGFIADRFSAKNLIALSLVSTALLGFWMSTIPTYEQILIIYCSWGVTTILLFWAPLMKATRYLGGDKDQGKTFGGLDAGRGIMAAILGTSILFLFSEDQTPRSEQVAARMYILSSIVLLVIALMVYLYLRLPNSNEKVEQRFLGASVVLKMRSLWHQMIFVLTAYVAYKCTDDISLYAFDVLQFDEYEAGKVGVMMIWLRPIAAISIGFIADYLGVRKTSLWTFVFVLIGSFLFYVLDFSKILPLFYLNLLLVGIGVYAMRGLYYAIMNEGNIPHQYSGTAIGFVSLVGYTPDIFMGPVMGYLLDTYSGITGHQYLFGYSLLVLVLGFMNLYLFGFGRVRD